MDVRNPLRHPAHACAKVGYGIGISAPTLEPKEWQVAVDQASDVVGIPRAGE
jgi:hypothetical protein